jgi:N-acetylneuraminic acid mutarotase
VGIIYNPNGSRAAYTKVRAIPVDHNPITKDAGMITFIDSTLTNDTGGYSFDSLPAGYYNIFGEGDSGVSYVDSFLVVVDTTIIFPDDTLGDPGTLRGVVRLQPGDDSRTVIILMFGTKTWEAPSDSIGNFTLRDKPAGIYNVRFLTTLNNYDPLDTQLTIVSGVDSMMPDTIRLNYTGVPIPFGLTGSYDTLNGLVNLVWRSLDFQGLEGYFVYRNDTASTIPVIISGSRALKDTFYTDTIFANPMDTNNFVFKYRLKSQDTNAVMSEKYSNSIEISAVSPTKVKTYLTLSSYSTINDTASINDTVKIVVNFSNETRKNTNIYWYVDTSDSIVRQVDIDTFSGSDTLQWSWSDAGSHFVSVKIKDIAGSTWEGSITIQIIQDPPIVNAGKDTTVSIYDTIRLHGTASDSFGHISKWEWDFGNTGTFITTSTSDTNILAPASADSNYQCVLRATDDDSNMTSDTVVITVILDPPVADAGADTSVSRAGQLTISGLNSVDSFGEIIRYEWDIGNNGVFKEVVSGDTLITLADTFNFNGFECVLRVTDDDDNSNLDTVKIFIGALKLVTPNAEFSARSEHSTVVFNNQLWVIGGNVNPDPWAESYSNDVWYSNDGITWSLSTDSAEFAARGEHGTEVFNNSIMVISGTNGQEVFKDTWNSIDGITWNQVTSNAPFKGRKRYATAIYNNKFWIIAGMGLTLSEVYSDAWYSDDGVNWQGHNNDTLIFQIRAGHSAVAFKNKIWIFGGHVRATEPVNDVWSSVDGDTWEKEISSAAFSPRGNHCTVVFDGKIFLVGGTKQPGTNDIYNDIWFSEDGINWALTPLNTLPEGRCNHTLTVFNNKLFIIGGTGDNGHKRNDVWCFD